MQVMRQIFSLEERKTSNVNGKNKRQVDPTKIAFVQKVTFQQYPIKLGIETERKACSACVEAIDEANRRLNRIKINRLVHVHVTLHIYS